MKTLAAFAILSVSLAAPAFAGDTPVIYTVTGIPTTVKGGGYPEVYFDRGGPVGGVGDPRTFRGPTASSGTQPITVSGTTVGTVDLAHGNTDALYAKLLTEARKRGLR